MPRAQFEKDYNPIPYVHYLGFHTFRLNAFEKALYGFILNAN